MIPEAPQGPNVTRCRAVFAGFGTSATSLPFNPAMTYVEPLSLLPIGPGTRFRAYLGKARRGMDHREIAAITISATPMSQTSSIASALL